jgi:hypothetical protein
VVAIGITRHGALRRQSATMESGVKRRSLAYCFNTARLTAAGSPPAIFAAPVRHPALRQDPQHGRFDVWELSV